MKNELEPRGMHSPAALELHIEELVLHGFAASDRFPIGNAVEQELSRLIAEQGLGPAVALSMEALDAGTFKVGVNARPQAIGVQLANSLHRGLTTTPNIQPHRGRQKKQKR